MWGALVLLAAQTVPVMPGAPGMPPFPYAQAQVCEGTEHGSRSAGLLDLQLGESFAAAMARSTYRFRSALPASGFHHSSDRLDLRLRDGARVLDRPGIGGMHWSVLQVTEDARDAGTIALIGFHDQARPLTLDEALDRAMVLRRWFAAGGFRALRAPRGERDSRGFMTTSAPNALARPRDLARARAMLIDERLATPEMNLFRLRRGPQELHVTLENRRRLTAVMTRGGESIFNACNGREWSLEVYLSAR